MPSVFTIEGHKKKKRGGKRRKRKNKKKTGSAVAGTACRRVKTGRKGSGCTIQLCPNEKTGRMEFKKGTRRCD